MTNEKPNGSANQQFYFDGNLFKSKAHGTVLDVAEGKYEEKVGILIILTRRWVPLLGHSSSSWGGLRPLAEAFFAFWAIFFFYSILAHIMVIFGDH